MAQLYIYTRTKELDYRAIAVPSEDFCSKEDRLAFRREINGVIDVETYVDELNKPRWFFSKRNKSILFGLGIMNQELSETCNTDYVGTPIRGFFGIVFNENEAIELPYDKEFFRLLYKKYIEPIWNVEFGDENAKQQTIELEYSDFDGTFPKITQQDNHIVLNEKIGKCVILGKIDSKEVFQQALFDKKDLSIVTGLNNKNHAYAKEAKYKFLNALVNGIDNREEQITIKPTITPKPSTQQQITKDSSPKKGYGLKLIILGVVVAISIAMLVGRCNKNNQTTSKQSSSGNPTQAVKMIK